MKIPKAKRILSLIPVAVLVVLASIYLTAVIDSVTLNTTLKRIFVFCYFIGISSLFVFLRHKLLGKPQWSIRTISAVLALVLVVFLQSTFLPAKTEQTISLHADTQAGSTGEVWLTEVIVDGNYQNLSQFGILENTGWQYSAEYDDYVFYASEEENVLTFSVHAEEVSLKFAAAPWCGNVEIVTPAEKAWLNLSHETSDAILFAVPTETAIPLVSRLLLSAGACVVLAFLLSSVGQAAVRGRKKESSAASEQPSHPQRSASADLLRTVALFLVVAVHFFLHSGFYNEPLSGAAMFLMTVIRTVCMTCVPLFLVLSGYLMCHKKLSRAYYSGVLQTVFTYILASLACLAYKTILLGQEFSFWQILTGLTNFTLANYAWYIEMYLGLFLLAPFINLFYHGVGGKKQKLILLGTFVFLTALPGVVNGLNIKLFPNWWVYLYPITYYLLGAYIREFGFPLKKSVAWLVLLLCSVAVTVISFFLHRFEEGHTSLPTVINTAMLFGAIITLDTEKWPEKLKKLLKTVSGLCLGAYLVSYIFDHALYILLHRITSTIPQTFVFFPVIVPVVFGCSLGLSWFLSRLYNLLQGFAAATSHITSFREFTALLLGDRKKTDKRRNIRLFVALVLCAALLAGSLYLLPDVPGKTVTLTPTGAQNDRAGGSEIWLIDILVDGTPLDLSVIPLSGGWEYREGDDVILLPSASVANSLQLTLPSAEDITLSFSKHAWGGGLTIQDGSQMTSYDLYSSGTGTLQYTLQQPTLRPSMTLTLLSLLLLVCLAAACILLFSQAQKNAPPLVALLLAILQFAATFAVLGTFLEKFSGLFRFAGMLCLAWAAGCLHFGKTFSPGQRLRNHALLWGLPLLAWALRQLYLLSPGSISPIFLLFVVSLCLLLIVLAPALRKKKGISWLVAAAIPLLCTVLVEVAGNSNLSALTAPYWCLNILLWAVITFIFSGILPWKRLGWCISPLLAGVFGIVNHFVIAFKDVALTPMDLLNAGTAMTVLGDYQYRFTAALSGCIAIFVFTILLIFLLAPKFTGRKATLIHAGASAGTLLVCALLFGTTSFTNTFGIAPDAWSSVNTYSRYGSAVSFVSYAQSMRPLPPEGYSEEAAEAILAEYTLPETDIPAQRPTVIAIMNESFSDLRVLGDLGDTENVLWYYDGLDNCVEKGSTYVSVRGGGTCNSEFEFLTGHSMSGFQNIFPYAQLDFENRMTLTSWLKELGYETAAVHPADAKNYRRDLIYSQMGFDEFYSMTSFEQYEKLFLDRTDDRDNYTELIRLVEETEEPLFLFNVTIQNHGGYSPNTLQRELAPVQVDPRFASYEDVSMYLSLVNESNHALEYLLNHFKNSDEKVVIVFFGDHQPGCLNEAFEATLAENRTAPNAVAFQQISFETPYFIWANYDLGTSGETHASSPNYLGAKMLEHCGLPLSPYHRFLLDMHQHILAINSWGYLASDGNWYALDSQNEYTHWLQNYNILQHYFMFAK